MKSVALVALMVLSVAGPALGARAELKLSVRQPEQLPFLYPDLRLELENSSSEPVFLPMTALQISMFIQTEDGSTGSAFPTGALAKIENEWGICQTMSAGLPRAVATIEWEEIGAGGKRSVAIPGNLCLAQMNQPGAYRIKVRMSTPGHEAQNQGSPPGRAVHGTYESNIVELRVKDPTGLDAEAVAWAKGSPMKPEILAAFPSSEYAAFFLWSGVAHLDRDDPVKTQSLIERGLYPSPNSVPDPTVPGNWTSLSSEGVARWQLEWGQRVVREHPNFPYREQVKVVVALAQMRLGQRDEALVALQELAEKGQADVSGWVKAFLGVVPKE